MNHPQFEDAHSENSLRYSLVKHSILIINILLYLRYTYSKSAFELVGLSSTFFSTSQNLFMIRRVPSCIRLSIVCQLYFLRFLCESVLTYLSSKDSRFLVTSYVMFNSCTSSLVPSCQLISIFFDLTILKSFCCEICCPFCR